MRGETKGEEKRRCLERRKDKERLISLVPLFIRAEPLSKILFYTLINDQDLSSLYLACDTYTYMLRSAYRLL